MNAINPKTDSVRSTPWRAGIFVGCLLAVATSMAHAATLNDSAPSLAVKYGDLNLSTEEGSHALYSRIASAARQLCDQSASRDLATFAANRQCESQAIARAVSDVHSPRLAAVYAMRAKRG